MTNFAAFEVEAKHPDKFLMNLIELSSEMVCLAASRHRASLKNPPKTNDAYCAVEKAIIRKFCWKINRILEAIIKNQGGGHAEVQK